MYVCMYICMYVCPHHSHTHSLTPDSFSILCNYSQSSLVMSITFIILPFTLSLFVSPHTHHLTRLSPSIPHTIPSPSLPSLPPLPPLPFFPSMLSGTIIAFPFPQNEIGGKKPGRVMEEPQNQLVPERRTPFGLTGCLTVYI